MDSKVTNVDVDDQQSNKQCSTHNITNEDGTCSGEHKPLNISTQENPRSSLSEVSTERQNVASGFQERKRRRVLRVVRISCTHCRQAKQACDDFRPCTRCIRLGLQNTCVDAPSSRPRRFSKSSESYQVSSCPSTSQGERWDSIFEPSRDTNDSRSVTGFDPAQSSRPDESSSASTYFKYSDKIPETADVSQNHESMISTVETSSAKNRFSRLFIPVECLTKGKPVEAINLHSQHSPASNIPHETVASEVLSQGRPLFSYDFSSDTFGDDCSCSFWNREDRSSTKNDYCGDDEDNSNLLYSLSIEDGLTFAVSKVWDIMFSWDQELQCENVNFEDEHLLDVAKSEILFYFVAKSVERYVQFFSSYIAEPPYSSLFTLNTAIQSLDSANEEFVKKMMSLLPPKSIVLSDYEQNIFLESVPMAALKMSVALDDSWHKILYVNGECCDLFGTTKKRLTELLGDPSSLHIIFVDNGWINEPLKTLQSLRKGILKRKTTFRLRSLRNEILDCIISTSFGTDSNWLPKYIVFYIQSIRKLDCSEFNGNTKESGDSYLEENQQAYQFCPVAVVRDNLALARSTSSWNSVESNASFQSYPSLMEPPFTNKAQNSKQQHFWPHV